MNIEPSDLAFIKRALLTNSVVLFTGAGFSGDAINVSDKPIPVGETLSHLLWVYLGYNEPHGKETLQQLFQAALNKDHDNLRAFLQRNFECKSFSSWYTLVGKFFWYRIYSTNIDNVLEKVYTSTSPIRLKRINGQKEDFSERDPFISEIQYVKLNGVDWKEPKGVTFSLRQYARRSTEAPAWYEQLARDFVTRVVLFVGTELDEQLFWNAIEMRGKKYGEGEKRVKSFWVKPSFSPVIIDNLKQYNVVGIPGTAKELFEILTAETNAERQLDEVLKATHPAFLKLTRAVGGALSQRQSQDLKNFYSTFPPVSIPDRIPTTRKSFLLGAAPDWPALWNHLDAPRTCTADLTKLFLTAFSTNKLGILSVSGPAGCGKSTTLKRLALELKAKGHLVFWADGEAYVQANVFSTVTSNLAARAVVFLDNVAQLKGSLIKYLKACKTAERPPFFVIADRTNKLFHFQGSLAEEYAVSPYGLPNLSAADIESLLQTLGTHGMLGKLQGMPHAKQVYEFSIRAGKQLLVAMREATSGADFVQIIGNEFSTLSTDEIKTTYLCVCIATAAGYAVSQQQFVAFSNLEPNQGLALLDSELRDIVIALENTKGALVARHRVIASLVVDQWAPRELLQEAYIRLLAVISKDVAHPVRAAARGFRLYRAVISHQAIWLRFPQAIVHARNIYESVRQHFSNDSHFWLQYGSLELEYGELELAEVYISSAESLAPDDSFVQNTKGLLAYRRAIATDRMLEAVSLRQNARTILEAGCKKRPDDNYAQHILHSMELDYIKAWLPKPEERKSAMRSLRDSIEVCVKTHRYSDRLSELRKIINDAYLELAL